MKRINLLYWIFTGLLVPIMGIGSVIGLTGDPKSLEVITSLGYPAYLAAFLNVARILALVAIFVPKFPRLKEWAYAGLAFDVIGAMYSLIMVRHSLTEIIFPSVALGIVFASYFLWHKKMQIQKQAPQ
jgi:hypothetical protein